MVLEQIDTDQRLYKLEMKKREAGLYHFAILLPEEILGFLS